MKALKIMVLGALLVVLSGSAFASCPSGHIATTGAVQANGGPECVYIHECQQETKGGKCKEVFQ